MGDEDELYWGNGTIHGGTNASTELAVVLHRYITPFNDDPVMGVIILSILVVYIVAGITGNTLVILSVLLIKKLRTSCNMLVLNLAIADLCVSLVVDPFAFIGVLYGRDYFDSRENLCQAIGTICLISCTCSLLSILAVSINRYVAILYHQYYAKIFTIGNTIVMCFGLWLIATAIEIPNHLGWGGNWFDDKQYICVYDRTEDYSFTLFFAGVAIIAPVCLVLYFYLRIYRYVGKVRNMITVVGNNTAKEMQTERRKMREQKKNIQLAKSLFVVFIAFLVSWGPYALVVLLDKEDTWPKLVHTICVTLAHVSSSGLNSLIYGVTQPQFKQAYINILTCRRGGGLSKHTTMSATLHSVGGTANGGTTRIPTPTPDKPVKQITQGHA